MTTNYHPMYESGRRMRESYIIQIWHPEEGGYYQDAKTSENLTNAIAWGKAKSEHFRVVLDPQLTVKYVQ